MTPMLDSLQGVAGLTHPLALIWHIRISQGTQTSTLTPNTRKEHKSRSGSLNSSLRSPISTSIAQHMNGLLLLAHARSTKARVLSMEWANMVSCSQLLMAHL